VQQLAAAYSLLCSLPSPCLRFSLENKPIKNDSQAIIPGDAVAVHVY
jgi:hypothetical protein